MAMTKCRNVIQIRNPVAMLPSWDKNMTPTLKEVRFVETPTVEILNVALAPWPFELLVVCVLFVGILYGNDITIVKALCTIIG